MEKYIITFEDGQHHVATEINDSDRNALEDGLLTIIRCSDGKELDENGEWNDLPKWNNS